MHVEPTTSSHLARTAQLGIARPPRDPWLRIGWSRIEAPILGVLEDVPSRAARDEGRLSIRPELLQSWYEQQEIKVAQSFEGFARFEFASALAPVMNKAITQLHRCGFSHPIGNLAVRPEQLRIGFAPWTKIPARGAAMGFITGSSRGGRHGERLAPDRRARSR